MGTGAAVAPAKVSCLLTPIEGAYGYYTAKPGTLTLVVSDVTGSTQINPSTSVVWDITHPGAQLAVNRTVTPVTLTFNVEVGKTYHVHLVCSLQPSPYEAKSILKEACGQKLDDIDLLNQAPGLVVRA